MIEIAVTVNEVEARLHELGLESNLGNVQAIEEWLEGIATACALASLQELDTGAAREYIAEFGTGCRCITVEKRATGDVVDTGNCPIHGHAA